MNHFPKKIPLSFTSSEGQYKDLFSPNDGELLTQVQQATREDIHFILSTLQKSQKTMSSLKPFERSRVLKSTAENLKKQEQELSLVIASEGGKPLRDARIEVSRAISTLELCAEETLRLDGEMIPMERTAAGKDHLSFTLRPPIGPVLAISAFNHPLNLIAHQVGCAIGSGNCVVLKPSSSTPMSAFFLQEAVKLAGLPEGSLFVINTDSKLMDPLVTSNLFGYLTFIGSALVGWELRRKIHAGVRISLEHGGQASAIVCEDADLDFAVEALIKGAFYHGGQVCISTQAIFLHKKIAREFKEKFLAAAKKLKVGSAILESTDIGPLIKPEEVTRVMGLIESAKKSGGKLLLPPEVSGNKNQYLSATVLEDTPHSSRFMQEEAFGPVVTLNDYENLEELILELNSKPYQFQNSLFTNNLNRAFEVAHSFSTMTLVINNHTAFRVDQMPFGGHKESGLGLGGVRFAMEEMTRMKQVIVNGKGRTF